MAKQQLLRDLAIVRSAILERGLSCGGSPVKGSLCLLGLITHALDTSERRQAVIDALSGHISKKRALDRPQARLMKFVDLAGVTPVHVITLINRAMASHSGVHVKLISSMMSRLRPLPA